MRITITCDAWWETKVSEALEQFSLRKINDFFYLKNYGNELEEVSIIFLCCNPEDYGLLESKVKFNKKLKKIDIYIVLEFELFLKIDDNERETIIFDKVKDEIPKIINEKTTEYYDFNEFTNDWNEIIKK